MPKTKNPHLYVVVRTAPTSHVDTQIQERRMLKTMVDQDTPEIRPRAVIRGVQLKNLGLIYL